MQCGMVVGLGPRAGTVATQAFREIESSDTSPDNAGFVVLEALANRFIHSPIAAGGPKRQLFLLGRPGNRTRPPAQAREDYEGHPERRSSPAPVSRDSPHLVDRCVDSLTVMGFSEPPARLHERGWAQQVEARSTTPWDDFQDRLQDRVPPVAWQTWIEPLDASLKEDTLQLVAPSDFHRRWVADRYMGAIESAAVTVFGDRVEISLTALESSSLAEDDEVNVVIDDRTSQESSVALRHQRQPRAALCPHSQGTSSRA